MLSSFLKEDRLPHALLLCGEDGIGKKKLALAFARLLFCRTRESCGICAPCQKVEHGNHPDLILVESDGSIGVDQSRMLIREVYQHPFEAEKRVIVIDRAETMTREASNALLKTLEEPPPFNVFFLIASSERALPMTIRSRCALIRFAPLRREDLRDYFIRVAGKNDEEAQLLSLIACGSIRRGLFWTSGDTLLVRRGLAELVTGRNRSFLATTLLSEKVSRADGHVSFYLLFLLSFFRDLYVVGETGDISLAVNRDLRDLMEGKQVDRKWIRRAFSAIQHAYEDMRYNVNRWLLFENLLLSITR